MGPALGAGMYQRQFLQSVLFFLGLLFYITTGCGEPQGPGSNPPPTDEKVSCDVIIAGGSTAALATALTAASEGARTCLLEPTDWVGGQITAGGVPAIDFAWHQAGAVDVSAIVKDAANQPREFYSWLQKKGNPGSCWVSRHCFEPREFLEEFAAPLINQQSFLKIFYNTVVKSVAISEDTHAINALFAIQRTPNPALPFKGFDRSLSSTMKDWYSPNDSDRYTKKRLRFERISQNAIFIDATELGELLALSDAPYLIGVEQPGEDPITQNERCGQAFTFTFVIKFDEQPVADPLTSPSPPHPDFYDLKEYTWDKVWTYRRLRNTQNANYYGQLSMQNWNPGNDYPFRFLFKSKTDTAEEQSDWYGGIDYAALEEAERHALGYFAWYRQKSPAPDHLELTKDIFGTASGLSKMPYLRDTRRSIGLDQFILRSADLVGEGGETTGKPFADRVAITSYAMDIHPMEGCSFSQPYDSKAVLPFFIPFRALTNAKIENLLVAGKTMAQSFWANTATRLQPGEWVSGIAAGAAAALMVKEGLTSRAAYQRVSEIQALVQKHAPIQWTINGRRYP